MATIMIDFENTHAASFRGLDLLRPTDSLTIFFSQACSKIRKEHMDIIENTGCLFRAVKLKNQRNNALDFYIAVAVGEALCNGAVEVDLITKDRGLQSIVDYVEISRTEGEKINVIKAEDIETALLFFGNPDDKDRRAILSDRSKQIDLTELSIRLDEREKVKRKIREAFSKSKYWYRTDEIIKYISEKQELHDRRKLYTGCLSYFGKSVGLEVYSILKEAI